MKQFEFRLQKVMETTENREDIQKRKLARAMESLWESEARLDILETELEQHLEHFNACRRRSSLKVNELRNLSGYLEMLRQAIVAQQEDIEKKSEVVRLNREKLLEISKDKKVLERLKEKKYNEFKKKLRSMEQKFMDELSARSYAGTNDNGNGIGQ